MPRREHMELGVKGQAEGGAVKWHPHTSRLTAQFATEDGRASPRGKSRRSTKSQMVPQRSLGLLTLWGRRSIIIIIITALPCHSEPTTPPAIFWLAAHGGGLSHASLTFNFCQSWPSFFKVHWAIRVTRHNKVHWNCYTALLWSLFILSGLDARCFII